MRFTGQSFSYDMARKLRAMRNYTKTSTDNKLKGIKGETEHVVLKNEEQKFNITYNDFNTIYRENMKTFLDNALAYRINDTFNSKGETDTLYSGNLQFKDGILAANNIDCKIEDGKNGFAVGAYNTVKGYNGFCAGKGVKARYNNQFCIGQYNVCYKDSVFEIGYGQSSSNKKTIFKIDVNGNVSAAGTFTQNVNMNEQVR